MLSTIGRDKSTLLKIDSRNHNGNSRVHGPREGCPHAMAIPLTADPNGLRQKDLATNLADVYPSVSTKAPSQALLGV